MPRLLPMDSRTCTKLRAASVNSLRGMTKAACKLSQVQTKYLLDAAVLQAASLTDCRINLHHSLCQAFKTITARPLTYSKANLPSAAWLVEHHQAHHRVQQQVVILVHGAEADARPVPVHGRALPVWLSALHAKSPIRPQASYAAGQEREGC